MMVLQSKLFKGDAELEAAAVSDPAHVSPGAKGAHVGKIQQALITLDGAGISADSDFGPATAAAVAAFKQKRQILNFAGKIDNIVGKKTVARLDSELLAKEGGGQRGLVAIRPGVIRVPGEPPIVIMPSFQTSEIARSGVTSSPGAGGRRFGISSVSANGDPSLQSLNPIVVVPFNEPPDSFILCESVEMLPGGPKGDKNDLNTSNPPQPALTLAEAAAVFLARTNFTRDAILSQSSIATVMEKRAMFEASNGGGGADGIDLMATFFKNTTVEPNKTFQVGSSFSNRVKNSKGFATELAGVTADITSAVQAQFLTGTIDYKKMRGISRPIPGKPHARKSSPNGVKGIVEVGYDLSEPDMVALVGSFQAATLLLKNFDVDLSKLTFLARLRFILLDHFGVDNSDVIFDFKGHGFPGQIAFWILQHEHGPTHTPYKYRVIVDIDISGSLLDPNKFPDLADEVLQQLNNPGR